MKGKKLKRIFDEIEDFLDFDTIPGGTSGYSIFITSDSSGRQIVKVETKGNIDKEALKKEIRSRYPNAKIIGLDDEPLIKEIEDEGKEKS